MSDLQKAAALLEGRTRPWDPAYRKPNMIGSTAGLKPGEQFPEYTAWAARRTVKQEASA